MKRPKIKILLAAIILAAGNAYAQDPAPGYTYDSSTAASTTNTQSGKVCGVIENGIYSYKGIPYAEAERFELPHAPKAWEGVRSSRYYGPTCPQDFRTGWFSDLGAAYTQWDDGYPGENCLRINIWTPGINDGKKRPVMFWIHGGGFAAGSGQEHPGYDGHNMAAKGDVVFVSINHRLNSLGFLDLSGFGDRYKYTGNLGMLDIVAALEWVKSNISNFGGDPENVTIMGQSGGGGKVSTLYCMKKARGLFDKAIVQSGSMLGCMKKEYSQAIGKRTAEILGFNEDNIDGIKTVPYADLLKANKQATEDVKNEAIKSGKIGILEGMMFGWQPVVEGDILTAVPFHDGTELLNNDIPMMMGSTLNEFAGYMGGPDVKTWDEAITNAKNTYGEKAEDVIREYRNAYPNAEPKDFFRLDFPDFVTQKTCIL
ncbi:MAG: carboxylesterase family protein [Prevotellaceae bacterium]|nr:carboxylesterase family protein [Prevotellaceae bacterium]